jgi:hypothetical protein
MADDATVQAICDGLADAMEREADRITDEQQRIRDACQPLGRIISEQEQENLNTLSVSALEYVKHLRESASLFREGRLE